MTAFVQKVRANTRARPRVVAGLLLACLLWSYWPTLRELWDVWQVDDDCSVGQLVPLVAIWLAWRERDALRRTVLRPHWAGAALLVSSQVVRFAGIYYAYASAERLSLLMAAGGCILLVAGTTVFRRLLAVQAFLLLMFPLPTRVHAAVAAPLQQAASALGAFGLELLGVYVRRDGNVLQLDGGVSVMVAEACSGLRMLTAFVFTAAVLVLVIRRPAWQKLVLLVASLPIAVLANAVRVLATSLIVHHGRDAALEHQVHDVAGVLMMPLALLMLLGVLKFLDQLAAAPRTRRPGAKRSFALPQVGARGAGRRPVFGNKVTR